MSKTECAARFLAYLHGVSSISSQTAELARQVWSDILKVTCCSMPVPSASTSPDGTMFFSWDRDDHHFELEVFPPDRPSELFYRNRATGELWGEDYKIGDNLSSDAIVRLNLIRGEP